MSARCYPNQQNRGGHRPPLQYGFRLFHITWTGSTRGRAAEGGRGSLTRHLECREISDLGFKMQESSNFQIPPSASVHFPVSVLNTFARNRYSRATFLRNRQELHG